ncbi:DUF871 domain-containing protein [Dellaglioa sp. L3N]
MLGFSIYLGDGINNETKHYIKVMHDAGFEGVFTSLHIPEEDSGTIIKALKILGQLCLKSNFTLMVDISEKSLNLLDFDLKETGVTGLRIDDGVSMEKVAALSTDIEIGLNASTISDLDIQQLTDNHANFKNIEAWHNYYPRPNTGLDENWLKNKNSWLKQSGFRTMAFVPGNESFRGPIGKGLPTLEKHRHYHVLAAMIDLIQNNHTDSVYIGDPRISGGTISKIVNYFRYQTMEINIESTYSELSKKTWHNRADVARDVVRLEEGRIRNKAIIAPFNNKKVRLRGSITQDNKLYGRYVGELQIVKTNLPIDDKVNLIGRVKPEDLDLIDYIGARQKIKFNHTNIKEE